MDNFFQKIGFCKHGGGNHNHPKNDNLKFSPDEVNTLLEHVKSMQYLTKTILDKQKELEAIIDIQGQINRLSERIGTPEQVANRVVTIREYEDNPDNVHYPTEKAVRDALATIHTYINALQDDIGQTQQDLSNVEVNIDSLEVKHALNYEWIGQQSARIDAIRTKIGMTGTNIPLTKVASLGEDGKILSSQLPDGIDDVIEGYYNTTDGKFYEEASYQNEIPAQKHKIYISVDTDKSYRWGGSRYGEIKHTAGTTDDVTEGQSNLYFTAERVQSITDPHTTNTGIHVTAEDKTAWNNKYNKPSGGIPLSDFTTGLQERIKLIIGYYEDPAELPTERAVGTMAFLKVGPYKRIPVWHDGYEKWVDANGNTVSTTPNPDEEEQGYYYDEIGNDNDNVNDNEG